MGSFDPLLYEAVAWWSKEGVPRRTLELGRLGLNTPLGGPVRL
jgi:hypothetical protein